MNVGISTWVWTAPATTDKLEWLVPRIRAIGFDVVEIPVEFPGQFDAAWARDLAAANGLEITICAVIGPGRDLLLDEEREAGIAYLQTCIEMAAHAGSPVLVGPFYSAVGRCWSLAPEERRREVSRLADVLRHLGDRAAASGVMLGIEPLNRFETSFLNTTAQALELVQEVDHPAVRLSLDLFHMGIEEKSPGDAIRQAGEHLVHLQVAENDRGTPGTGHLPWRDVASALREIDYSGTVVIETFSERVEAIARAASIWRPLAADSDSLASEGLHFLRQILAE